MDPGPAEREGPRIPLQLPERPLCGQLVGREAERRELAERLRRGGSVFLLGDAGSGKTALAGEVVRSYLDREGASLKNSPFPDGVVLLDLHLLQARRVDAWNALADALRPDLDPRTPVHVRARTALRGKRVLIIIEGAELADGSQERCRLPQLFDVCDAANQRLILTRDVAQTERSPTLRLSGALSPTEAGKLFDLIARRQLDPQPRQAVLDRLEGHPLALTWAASLLGPGGDSPQAWLADWDASGSSRSASAGLWLPLHWLFRRSVGRLEATERIVLAAAGLLARCGLPQSAMTAALGDAVRARAALERLSQLNWLRRSTSAEEEWSFSHVLAHRFAVAERGSAELRGRLASWLQNELSESLEREAIPRLRRALWHARAFLENDSELAHGSLANRSLPQVIDTTIESGQLGLAAMALPVVAAWMDRFPLTQRVSGSWLRERAVILSRLGDLQRALGDLDRAQGSYADCRNTSKSLVLTDPSNLQWQHDLFVSYDRLGSVQQAQGDLMAALGSFTAGRDIAEKVARSEPSNIPLQRELMLSYRKLGDVQLARGDLEDALRSYEAAKGVSEQVAQSDPDNPEWQRDVSCTLTSLAELHQKRGSPAMALQYAKQSLAIDERLIRLCPGDETYQADVEVSRDLVARLCSSAKQS
jgi:tetratricopeptide (TPR) repeat protein